MKPLHLISAVLLAVSLAACDQAEEAAETPAEAPVEQPDAAPPETGEMPAAEAPMGEGEMDEVTPPEEPVTIEEDVMTDDEEGMAAPDEEQPQ